MSEIVQAWVVGVDEIPPDIRSRLPEYLRWDGVVIEEEGVLDVISRERFRQEYIWV